MTGGLVDFGAVGRNRTGDLRITNALLYQLSYIGVARIIAGKCVVVICMGYIRGNTEAMRDTTVVWSNSASVASIAGVCVSPVTNRRTGIASFGILS